MGMHALSALSPEPLLTGQPCSSVRINSAPPDVTPAVCRSGHYIPYTGQGSGEGRTQQQRHSCLQEMTVEHNGQFVTFYPDSTGSMGYMINGAHGEACNLEPVDMAYHSHVARGLPCGGDSVEVWLVITRKINPGEELLYDYHAAATPDEEDFNTICACSHEPQHYLYRRIGDGNIRYTQVRPPSATLKHLGRVANANVFTFLYDTMLFPRLLQLHRWTTNHAQWRDQITFRRHVCEPDRMLRSFRHSTLLPVSVCACILVGVRLCGVCHCRVHRDSVWTLGLCWSKHANAPLVAGTLFSRVPWDFS